MGERYELFVAVLELVRVEALLPYFRGQVGRPEEDRAALARAFIAKAVFDIPTTRGLIERLEVDGKFPLPIINGYSERCATRRGRSRRRSRRQRSRSGASGGGHARERRGRRSRGGSGAVERLGTPSIMRLLEDAASIAPWLAYPDRSWIAVGDSAGTGPALKSPVLETCLTAIPANHVGRCGTSQGRDTASFDRCPKPRKNVPVCCSLAEWRVRAGISMPTISGLCFWKGGTRYSWIAVSTVTRMTKQGTTCEAPGRTI